MANDFIMQNGERAAAPIDPADLDRQIAEKRAQLAGLNALIAEWQARLDRLQRAAAAGV